MVWAAGKRAALLQRQPSAERAWMPPATLPATSAPLDCDAGATQALALIFRFNPRRCIEAERCRIGNRAKAPAAGRGKIKGAGLKDQAARETRRNRAATCGLRSERACRRGGAGDWKQTAA
jgi:hypothetical protein